MIQNLTNVSSLKVCFKIPSPEVHAKFGLQDNSPTIIVRRLIYFKQKIAISKEKWVIFIHLFSISVHLGRYQAIVFLKYYMKWTCIWNSVFHCRFGRKKTLIGCIVLITAPNIATSFVSNFQVFVFLRFLSGFAVGGLLGTGYVLGM